MKVFFETAQLKSWRKTLSGPLAFIPTMGALHHGHMNLVDAAKKRCPHVIVSIFVNPGQFGPNEDFDRYPRSLSADLELLEAAGVDAVFCPASELIYPNGYKRSVRVYVPRLGKRLCGKFRPRMFEGVCTVLARLIHCVGPDELVMGEKDFQQVTIVRELCDSFFSSVTVVMVATCRDVNGLALSSRNQYLSCGELASAPSIYKAMLRIKSEAEIGRVTTVLVDLFHDTLNQLWPEARVEYCEIIGARLDKLRKISVGARLVVAIWIGHTRLIDNLLLVE